MSDSRPPTASATATYEPAVGAKRNSPCWNTTGRYSNRKRKSDSSKGSPVTRTLCPVCAGHYADVALARFACTAAACTCRHDVAAPPRNPFTPAGLRYPSRPMQSLRSLWMCRLWRRLPCAMGRRPAPAPPSPAALSAITASPPFTTITLVFTAEGDLWQVGVNGGVAQRLTTHPSEESRPRFLARRPDDRILGRLRRPHRGLHAAARWRRPAFDKLMTAPRRSWSAGRPAARSSTPRAASRRCRTRSSRASTRRSGARTLVPLAQASDGSYGGDGRTLFFTRLAFQGSYTKRYQGGTAQNLWRFADGDREATPLTADYKGTSKSPMPWNGPRLFSERPRRPHEPVVDGRGAAADLKQHTQHDGLDAQSPSLSNGKIVYQLGADLRALRHPSAIRTGPSRSGSCRTSTSCASAGSRRRWNGSPPRTSRPPATASSSTRAASCSSPRRSRGGSSKPRATRKVRYRDRPLLPRRQVAADARRRERRSGVLARAGQRHRRARQLTADGKVLRWDGIPSPDGTPHRALRQGSAAVDLRGGVEAAEAGRQVGRRRLRRRALVARRQVARLHGADANQMTRMHLYERRDRPVDAR